MGIVRISVMDVSFIEKCQLADGLLFLEFVSVLCKKVFYRMMVV